MQKSQEEVLVVVLLAVVVHYKQHSFEDVETSVKRVVAESFLASVRIPGFRLFPPSWLFHFS